MRAGTLILVPCTYHAPAQAFPTKAMVPCMAYATDRVFGKSGKVACLQVGGSIRTAPDML